MVTTAPARRAHTRTRAGQRSADLSARAEAVIPGGSQTFSKGPTQFVQGVAPAFLQRGRGSHVWDVDDREYIDYPMALGPVILGYDEPAVTRAVRRQLADGPTFSLPHPIEVETAELLTEVIPCAEMVRFAKNGSDATTAAVRLARAVTGREVIVCCGFHGWHDWYIGTTTRSAGVPEAVRALTHPFIYNHLESLERVFAEHQGRVAAVILEPMGVEAPQPEFLEGVCDLAHREGAVLIFDEILTGFRLALGGAQEYFGVVPDLACVGKSMANGFPLAALVGRRELMRRFEDVFFSCTFGGEALSLAAATATITYMRRHDVIPALWAKGRVLQDGYTRLAATSGLERRTRCAGLPPRTVIQFTDDAGRDDLELKSLFQQECITRGVLFSGLQNICFRHSEADLTRTLTVYGEALAIVADAIAKSDVRKRLQGPPVQPVFRQP